MAVRAAGRSSCATAQLRWLSEAVSSKAGGEDWCWAATGAKDRLLLSMNLRIRNLLGSDEEAKLPWGLARSETSGSAALADHIGHLCMAADHHRREQNYRELH